MRAGRDIGAKEKYNRRYMIIEDAAFDSELFVVKRLADGVFALIEREGRTGSNAGIIDLGNDAIIFDTFLNIDAAGDLRRACKALTGKFPSFVVNSHRHADHIIGNCLFPEGRVISSEKTRDAIIEFKKEFDREKPEYSGKAAEIQAKLEAATDKTEAADLKNELNFLSNMAKPQAAVRVPDMTFDGDIVFHGAKRSMRLQVYPVGHSLGDTAAFLPEDKICFAGDLLFFGSHPWIGSGEPEKLIGILGGMAGIDIRYFVPGHGPIGTKEDVEKEIRYLKEITALVESRKEAKAASFSVEELSPEFREWDDLCFQWNIRFLLGRK